MLLQELAIKSELESNLRREMKILERNVEAQAQHMDLKVLVPQLQEHRKQLLQINDVLRSQNDTLSSNNSALALDLETKNQHVQTISVALKNLTFTHDKLTLEFRTLSTKHESLTLEHLNLLEDYKTVTINQDAPADSAPSIALDTAQNAYAQTSPQKRSPLKNKFSTPALHKKFDKTRARANAYSTLLGERNAANLRSISPSSPNRLESNTSPDSRNRYQTVSSPVYRQASERKSPQPQGEFSPVVSAQRGSSVLSPSREKRRPSPTRAQLSPSKKKDFHGVYPPVPSSLKRTAVRTSTFGSVSRFGAHISSDVHFL